MPQPKSFFSFFFSSMNMYQAKSGVNIFYLYWWGEVPRQKIFFFQSEHVSSQIWCQFFSLYQWEVPSTKKIFSQYEHVSSQIWCQKFFPLLVGRGVLQQKFFFHFFFQSEHVSSQIWCQNFFPLSVGWGGGPLTKRKFFQSEHVSSQICCQNFSHN